MASPSNTLATLRPDLSTFYEWTYMENQAGFIGSQVMPILPVPTQAGNFGRVTLETLAKHGQNTERAVATGYLRDRLEFTTDSFATTEHGVEEVVDDREANMYFNYLNAEQDATARAVNKILQARERRIAEEVMDTVYYLANPDLNHAAATPWSTYATATPIDDVETAYRKVRDGTGLRPNALILNEYLFRDVRQCQQVIDRVAATGAGFPVRATDITAQQLAEVFDIQNVLVASGMENTANPNDDATMLDIWPRYGMVTRIGGGSDIRMNPVIGRTFHWSADGSQIDGYVESYREEPIRGGVIRCRHDVDEKILYKDLACLITSV